MYIKSLALVAGLSVLAATASAQSISSIDNVAVPINQIRTGMIIQNSASVPAAIGFNPYDSVSVLCQGTATTTSASVALTLDDGSLTSATTVNCSTTMTQIMAITAGQTGATGIYVSPTAGLTSTNTVKTLVVRKPTVFNR